MNHPFVKKLLKNELLIWGLGVLVVVALPMGVVVLEATTVSSSSKRSTKGRATSEPKKRAVAPKPRRTSEAVAETNLFEDISDDITDGILDSATVFGSSESDYRDGLVNVSAVSSDAEATNVLPEVSSETVGSGMLYFGGGLTDSFSGDLSEVVVAEVVVSDRATASNEGNSLPSGVADLNEPGSTDTVNTAGLVILTGDSEAAEPDLIALMAAGNGTAVKQESKSQDKAQVTESPSQVEEKEDTRERTKVTLIRPKGEVVR
jgi:hypothetical protein